MMNGHGHLKAEISHAAFFLSFDEMTIQTDTLIVKKKHTKKNGDVLKQYFGGMTIRVRHLH